MTTKNEQRYNCKTCGYYNPDDFCLGCTRESHRTFRLEYLEILKSGTVFQLADHVIIPATYPKQNGLLSLIWIIHWEYLLQNYPNAHVSTINACICDGTYDEARLTPDNPLEKYGDECIYRVHEIADDITICCCKGDQCRRILKRIYMEGIDYPYQREIGKPIIIGKSKEEESQPDEPDSDELIDVLVDLNSYYESVPKNYFPNRVRDYVIDKMNPDDIGIDQIYCDSTDEYY